MHLKKNTWRILGIVISLCILAIPFFVPDSSVQAQNLGWSYPQTMPSFDLTSYPPILLADQNGAVHAFSSQFIKTQDGEKVRAIVYNKWTVDAGWTSPVDILVSPSGEARVTDVYFDQEGFVHLVFFGGNNTGADIYYSRAPIEEVGSARSWSKPFIIGSNAGDPEGAVIVEDAEGVLYAVYNGREFGNGLYVVYSGDGGENWSSYLPIFIAEDDEPNIAQLDVIKSGSGSFHAIWGVYSADGQGRGIYYARSENGLVWSEPVLLADTPDGLGTQKPTIIEFNDTIFALYIMPPKVTMRRSADDGRTWDDPSIIFPRQVGVNGDLSLVVDAEENLHLFFGQRISGNPDIHGMWHSTYLNNRWAEPEAIIKGPLKRDVEGITGFDPNFARAVVSRGNHILVTWRTDPAAGNNGVWFSFEGLSAPEFAVEASQVVPGVTDVPLDVTESPPAAVLTPSPEIVTNIENDDLPTKSSGEQGFLTNPSAYILISTIFLLIFIAAVFSFKSSKR